MPVKTRKYFIVCISFFCTYLYYIRLAIEAISVLSNPPRLTPFNKALASIVKTESRIVAGTFEKL